MTLKSAALLLGSSLAIGGATYYVYRLIRQKSNVSAAARPAASADDPPVHPFSPAPASRSSTRTKKVLVLGLKGAGKSSLVECLTRGAVESSPAPTSGFNVVQCRIPAYVADEESEERDHPQLAMDVWEIGGDDAFRKFWSHFYQDTDCLLFLLDAGAGSGVLGEAAEELARAAGDYRMGAVPLVVVATHQDKPRSRMEPKDLRRLLVDVGISPHHLLRIHGIATPTDDSPVGVDDLKNLLSKILS